MVFLVLVGFCNTSTRVICEANCLVELVADFWKGEMPLIIQPESRQHGSYPPKSISRLADHSIRNLSFEACHPSDSSFELQWRRTNLKFRSDLGKQSKLAMLVSRPT
jgi:hypothetical protein